MSGSLFAATPNEQLSFASMVKNTLDVVHVDFIGAETLSWEQLFEGYDTLYAITYSSGINFIGKLLGKFKKAEIIFGYDGVLSYNTQEIFAYQLKTVERLRELSQSQTDLLSRIDNGSLRMYVSRKQLSHEKIYILEAIDRKRVVMGSANMSYSAFSGRQRENICYSDHKKTI
ncbi:MAG: phospholipase D family protein [Oscillospiraceae bacterium]|nr:phospholipase D family protein [Oscillospiraceae bacterium]